MILNQLDDIHRKAELIAKLKGSYLLFLQTFYKILNQRDFMLSNPLGSESHFITVARELVRCHRLETLRLMINIPPGYGKSTMLAFWVAWCFTHNSDSRFLYVSCGQDLAAGHTDTIRRVMMLPEYSELFDVHLRKDSKAKDHFQTTTGGAVAAFGAGGMIVGRDAGYPNLDRFSGALLIDDAHKPKEVHSDVVREEVIQNYRETLQIRVRGRNVPIIFLGQRLHEADLPAYLIGGKDGTDWKKVILEGEPLPGQPLYPEVHSAEWLKTKREKDPYVYWSQIQQQPQPAGGSLFKEDYFIELDKEPAILATFIVADTAETTKSWNDASVFGFFGIYKTELDDLAIHCLYLEEMRVEPADLEFEFIRFYGQCKQHSVKPNYAFIEKKSTGTTLISVMRKYQGLRVNDISRNADSPSKTGRFINAQPYFASKLLTFPLHSRHNKLVIDHLAKITANNTHAFDDIADVCCDAIRLALVEKVVPFGQLQSKEKAASIMARDKHIARVKQIYGNRY